jgi:hypothetical protein
MMVLTALLVKAAYGCYNNNNKNSERFSSNNNTTTATALIFPIHFFVRVLSFFETMEGDDAIEVLISIDSTLMCQPRS